MVGFKEVCQYWYIYFRQWTCLQQGCQIKGQETCSGGTGKGTVLLGINQEANVEIRYLNCRHP